ncbi:MAG: methyltransferase domain-containing protein [Polyangiaceae bacterium]
MRPDFVGARYPVEERNVAVARAIGRPERVLDVGCGGGQNGAVARARGAIVTGIERDPSARSRASRRLHEVLDVDLESIDALHRALADRTFDLVVCADVLEHLRDPAATLRALVEHLEEEGRVIVSLPNVAVWTVRLGLLAGRFDYEDSGVLDRTHLRFFTERSARALCEEAGLEVLGLDQNPMFVRALRSFITRAARATVDDFGRDPDALASSAGYKLYQAAIRPLEDVVGARAPGLLAFQHVLVARKPPRPRRLRVAVGMLTLNEEGAIAPMIDEIRHELPDAEILVVDSSRDRTAEIARSQGARVVRQAPPRGHGPAMELLMYEAARHAEALIYLDCDFTYPTRYLRQLRAVLEEGAVDVVNCARTRTRPPAMPLANYAANRVFAGFARGLYGVPTTDLHSGMRAYRTSVIRAFDFDGEGDALPIDTLLLPALAGFRVVDMPIDYAERVGDSKLRKFAGTAWTFVRLARLAAPGSRGSLRYVVR